MTDMKNFRDTLSPQYSLWFYLREAIVLVACLGSIWLFLFMVAVSNGGAV